jgi:hypothetical protein
MKATRAMTIPTAIAEQKAENSSARTANQVGDTPGDEPAMQLLRVHKSEDRQLRGSSRTRQSRCLRSR